MIWDYFKISFKNLKKRGTRSWLTLLGIFIGVVAVVALVSLGNGLKVAVNSQFGISSTEIITVKASGLNMGPPGTAVADPLTMEDVEAILEVNGVKRAVRRNMPSGKLEFNEGVVFGFFTNMPDGDEEAHFEIEFGRSLEEGDNREVVLGYNFHEDKLGLGKPIKVGDNVLIQDEKFEVIGLLKKQGSFINDNIVLMNEQLLEDLMGYGDEVDLIIVQIKDKDEIDKVKESIERLLRDRRDVDIGEEDFEVSTPDAMMETVNNILGGIQAFIVIIALISIIVGAVGIVNTMTTSVLERKKEIGIMKAVGAKNSQIFLQFFIESSLLGLVGGAAGTIVGTLIGVFGTLAIGNWLGATIESSINFGLI